MSIGVGGVTVKFKTMNKDLATALGRLDRYLFRVKRAIRKGDLTVALADTVELSEIARRLSVRLEYLVRESYARQKSLDTVKGDCSPSR